MKKIISTLVIVFLCFSSSAQTIFDIEIDKLYFNDNVIRFINEGKLNSFNCFIETIKIRDFQNKLIADCTEDNKWWWSNDTVRIKFNEIKEFNSPSELITSIKSLKFVKDTLSNNPNEYSYIQYLDNNLIAQIHLVNHESQVLKWEINDVKIWNYAFLRINKKQFIIILLDEDAWEEGYIIPLKKGAVAVINDVHYEEQGDRVDTFSINKYISIESFFRAKKVQGGYQLTDMLFNEKILDEKFDHIKIGKKYIFCEDQRGISVYDKNINMVFESPVRVAYDSIGSIQFLSENKIQWLDYNGIVHDTFPAQQLRLCGNTFSESRKINKTKTSWVESYGTENGWNKIQRDSVCLAYFSSITSMKYLNNSTNHYYDGFSNLGTVFSLPYSHYIIEEKKTQKLISITNKRHAKTRNLVRQKNYVKLDSIKIDSIDALISNLKDEIEIKILFEGSLESYGYNHPIKFKEGNLFGYYPQNEKAKYRNIDKFKFFFAKFEHADGRKGWLDIYGNEYFRE